MMIAIKTITSGKCFHCGTEQEFFVIDNTSTALSLTNYKLFKTLNLNVCKNCGYISEDLTKDSKVSEFIDLSTLNINDFDDYSEHLSILEFFYKSTKDSLLKIRALSSIFTIKSVLYQKYLIENYTSPSPSVINDLDAQHNELMTLANTILDLTNDVESSNMIKCLKVEMLAYVNKSVLASDLLESLPVDSNLKDYLLDCIDLG